MSHYFVTDDSLPENRKEISFRFLGDMFSFVTMAGVFSKQDLDFGTRVLLETMSEQDLNGTLLDLGTGYGPVGVLIKHMFPKIEVTMSDVNQRACQLALDNVKRYNLTNKVILSDGFSAIDGSFDNILFNPPIRAGKKVIYRLFKECQQHLTPSGSLWIVIRKDQGALSAAKELNTYFANVECINKDRGYLVYKARMGKPSGD